MSTTDVAQSPTYAAQMSVREMQRRKVIEGRPYPLTDGARLALADEFERLFTLAQNHHVSKILPPYCTGARDIDGHISHDAESCPIHEVAR